MRQWLHPENRDAVKNWRAQPVRDRGAQPVPGLASTTMACTAIALRRAGIGYEEIVGGHHTPAELRRVVERVVQK